MIKLYYQKYKKYKYKYLSLKIQTLKMQRGGYQNKVTIIITVPHSFCDLNTSIRNCDTRAESAANIINTQLKKLLPENFNIIIIIADALRTQSRDLNRENTRDLEWRKNLDNLIQTSLEKHEKVFLLDIHSFPNNKESFGLNNNNKVPKIVLLKFPGEVNINLNSNILTTLEGSDKNDIILTAYNKDISALLLEFNEDIDYLKDDEIIDFCRNLNNYLRSFLLY